MNRKDQGMDMKIRNLVTLFAVSWLSLLPVTQASRSDESGDSTMTVVMLFLLLIVLCIALILAWKRLIHTEGGEGYHPRELWGRAQEYMQNVKTRWSHGEQEDDITVEDNQEEDDDETQLKDEDPDITAL